jgi:hypothetical protein
MVSENAVETLKFTLSMLSRNKFIPAEIFIIKKMQMEIFDGNFLNSLLVNSRGIFFCRLQNQIIPILAFHHSPCIRLKIELLYQRRGHSIFGFKRNHVFRMNVEQEMERKSINLGN